MKSGDKMWIWGFLVGWLWGVFFVCLLFAFGVVHAQEGCGEWVKTKGLLNIEDFLLGLDSVWIPKPCPDTITAKENGSAYIPILRPGETAAVKVTLPNLGRTKEEPDTLFTDWIYADSIYIFHFGKKFVWKKPK